MGVEIRVVVESRWAVVAWIVVVIDGCLVCSVPVAGIGGVAPVVGRASMGVRRGVVEVAGVGEPVAVVLKLSPLE